MKLSDIKGVVVAITCTACEGKGLDGDESCSTCFGEGVDNTVISFEEFAKHLSKFMQMPAPLTVPLPKAAPKGNGVWSPRSIQEVVAKYFGMTRQELLHKSRNPRRVRAGYLAMREVRHRLQLSYTEVAKAFRRVDHSTISKMLKRMEDGEYFADATRLREVTDIGALLDAMLT
jgi:chromosomal replication initiation ATPase DnaA